MYNYLQPFGGVVCAALFLGELIIAWQIFGGVLVVLSMLLYRSDLSSMLSPLLYRLRRRKLVATVEPVESVI